MTWHVGIASTCSPEQAAVFSEICCSATLQSGRWKSSITQEQSSKLGNATASSLLSRYGTMFVPIDSTTTKLSRTSECSRGLPRNSSYVAGSLSHAKTSAQQAEVQESKEQNRASGPNLLASFARFDRDTCSWKIPQCSLLGDSEPFSETWPQWGMWDAGACWELPTLVPRISGNGSGFWPTPTKSDGTGGPGNSGREGGDNLRTAVSRYATPKASDGERGIPSPSGHYKLPTPTANDAKNNGGPSQQARNSKSLNAVAGGSLNPDWVEWLMNWPIKWSSLNAINPQEFKRWAEASSAHVQGSSCVRTVWWDRDPSETPHGREHDKQSKNEHPDSVLEMPRVAARQSTMGGPLEGAPLPVLRSGVYVQAAERENVQPFLRKQVGVDETPYCSRIVKNSPARAHRLKAIGNGQVPQCAAAAWMILETEQA